MTKDLKLVDYKGHPVAEEWLPKIEAAQKQTHALIGGKEYERIRYGSENPPWSGDHCHDCAVIRGEYHVPSCDVERCPACGDQAIGCDCDWDSVH